MSPTIVNILRESMEFLGRVVEGLIGKAKNAKVQVSARGGTQPVLSLEGQLSPPRIRDLIEAAAQKVLWNTIPTLKGLSAIEIGEGQPIYSARLLACQAKVAIGVEIGSTQVVRQGDASRGFFIRSSITKFPFRDGSFSYFLARFATQYQGDLTRALQELGRVMVSGGQGVVVDYHPFGLYAKKGTHRARPADSGVHRFEDYYRLCRQTGFRVVDVREVFIDDQLRQFFKEEEIQVYRNLKGTPLLIFLFVYKPKGK